MDRPKPADARLIGPLLRFFAHLVLVLRSLGQPVPDTAANIILQTYLGVLEQEGDHSLIAMYAACLREGNGEDSYARILRCESRLPVSRRSECLFLAMDPNSTKEAKMEALQRAKQHNLNVATIATETVRMILEAVFSVSHDSFLALTPSLTDPRTFPRCRAINQISQALALDSQNPTLGSSDRSNGSLWFLRRQTKRSCNLMPLRGTSSVRLNAIQSDFTLTTSSGPRRGRTSLVEDSASYRIGSRFRMGAACARTRTLWHAVPGICST